MCDCISKVNVQLAAYGDELNTAMKMDGTVLLCVGTSRIDGNKRKKPHNMFCSYCPFCGEKMPMNKEPT